jgi:hypothetical protein
LAVVVGVPEFNTQFRTVAVDIIWVYERSQLEDEVFSRFSMEAGTRQLFSITSVSEDFPLVSTCSHLFSDRTSIDHCINQIFYPPKASKVEVVALSALKGKVPLHSISEVLAPLQRRSMLEGLQPGTPLAQKTQYVYSHQISFV